MTFPQLKSKISTCSLIISAKAKKNTLLIYLRLCVSVICIPDGQRSLHRSLRTSRDDRRPRRHSRERLSSSICETISRHPKRPFMTAFHHGGCVKAICAARKALVRTHLHYKCGHRCAEVHGHHSRLLSGFFQTHSGITPGSSRPLHQAICIGHLDRLHRSLSPFRFIRTGRPVVRAIDFGLLNLVPQFLKATKKIGLWPALFAGPQPPIRLALEYT